MKYDFKFNNNRRLCVKEFLLNNFNMQMNKNSKYLLLF